MADITSSKIQKNRIFNPLGKDDLADRTIIK